MTNKIEIFNTGGGIHLAETALNGERYAVVSTEAPDFLAVYNRVDEDEESYMPEDMVASTHKDELDEDTKKLHAEMVEALKRQNAWV